MRLELRSGLRLRTRVLGEDLVIEDLLLDRTIPLDHHAAAVVERVDGVRTLGELVSTFDDWQPPVSTERREEAVRTLFRLGLISESSTERVAEAARRTRVTSTLERDIRTAPGADFACTGSGDCCRVYELGPLGDEDIARISALPFREDFQLAATEPFFETRAGERFLRRVGESCLFRDPSGKCGIQRRYGREAKPGLCRLYPLSVRLLPDGYRISNEGECAHATSTGRSGRVSRERAMRVVSDAGMPARMSSTVQLVDEMAIDFTLVDALLSGIATRIANAPELTALGAVSLVGRIWRVFIDAITRMPLARGVTTACVDAALAAAEPPARPNAALGHVASALLRELSPACAWKAPEPALRHASRHEMGDITMVVETLARNLVEGAAPRGVLADALALPTQSGFDARLRSEVVHALGSNRATRGNRPLVGLLGITVVALWSDVGARIRARLDGARLVSLAHLDAAHATAQRIQRFLPTAFWTALSPYALDAAESAAAFSTRTERRRALPVLHLDLGAP